VHRLRSLLVHVTALAYTKPRLGSSSIVRSAGRRWSDLTERALNDAGRNKVIPALTYSK
jgi:hypothetical protein